MRVFKVGWRADLWAKNYLNYANWRVQNADVIIIGADAKLYFYRQLFAQAGPWFTQLVVMNTLSMCLGSSAAVGISLPVDEHFRFNVSGYSELIYLGYGVGRPRTMRRFVWYNLL